MTTLEALAARVRPLAQSCRTYPPGAGGDPTVTLRLSHDELLALDTLLQKQLGQGPVEKGEKGARFMELAALAVSAGAEAAILISIEANGADTDVGVAGATAQHCAPGRRRLHQDIIDGLSRAFGKPLIDQHATAFKAGEGKVVLGDISPGEHPEQPKP